MRSIHWFVCLLIAVISCITYSQNLTSGLDIIACFNIDEEQNNTIERISREFSRELELKYKNSQLAICVFDGTKNEFNYWTDTLNSRFYAVIDIKPGRWEVNRRFMLPFILNVYRNNFKIEAFVKLFRRGVKNPLLVKNIKAEKSGHNVFQLLADNPHDGNLVASAGEKIRREEQTETELIRKISKDIFDVMKEYGG